MGLSKRRKVKISYAIRSLTANPDSFQTFEPGSGFEWIYGFGLAVEYRGLSLYPRIGKVI